MPTLKSSSTQEQTSSRARHTKLILQQCRNIALSFNIQAARSLTKPTDISKLITGHFIALQREEISSIHQITNTSFPNQETLTSHPSNPNPQQGNSTIKRTRQTARIQKGHPKQSNVNKVKRQRNTQQAKEQDKCPSNQTKEEEIGNLPEKKFQLLMLKMIKKS